MGLLRQLGVLVLVLASSLAPTMACMLPGAHMTSEERACCGTMHDQCEQMNMPASHGCCKKTAVDLRESALILNTRAITQIAAAGANAWLPSFALLNSTSAISGWIEQPDSSPPKSPPATISILRI